MSQRTVESPTAPSISGKTVVIAMFCFAAVLTAFLYYYWNKHIEPFMPLQLALEQQFEGSSPRVEGGQRKMSKGTPTILRVTMRVPFDPKEESDAGIDLVHAIAGTARKFVSLSDYEILTVHFYQPNPGGKLRTKTIETPIAELPRAD